MTVIYTGGEHLDIKSWAEEDRPREKLLLKGRSVLTDAELIAILIGSGTTELSAVDVSKAILSFVNNDLNKLAGLTVQNLTKFKGIGEAKAITIISAIELGRRRKDYSTSKTPKIQVSEDAFKYMKPTLLDLQQEEFWVLLLNRANGVIKSCQISSGGISSTVVDPKIIFSKALENMASSIILVHNHPSGNINPSQTDVMLTKKLKTAGDIMEIPVLDHIIFTNEKYYSFKDDGAI